MRAIRPDAEDRRTVKTVLGEKDASSRARRQSQRLALGCSLSTVRARSPVCSLVRFLTTLAMRADCERAAQSAGDAQTFVGRFAAKSFGNIRRGHSNDGYLIESERRVGRSMIRISAVVDFPDRSASQHSRTGCRQEQSFTGLERSRFRCKR